MKSDSELRDIFDKSCDLGLKYSTNLRVNFVTFQVTLAHLVSSCFCTLV